MYPRPKSALLTRRRLIMAAAALAGVLGLAACSPEKLLDSLSSLRGGDPARLAVDGVSYGPLARQKLDVWVPRSASTRPLPVVVFFYGGGWVKGERGSYGFAARAFASRGYVVVVPDYRLVPETRFPGFIEDGAAAVRWAQDHAAEYGGDPKQILLSGHSAGAYIGAMLALDRHYLDAAGVKSGAIKGAALLSGPYDFYPWTEDRGRDALGNWPRPLETQPITYARRDAPPLLLMHGTADTVVRPYNAEHLAAALHKQGTVAELKLYPGKSHIDTVKSLSPLFRGSTPALADSIAFFHRHTQ